ncbi:MAG: hypothetical protein J6C93_07315 [Clostridia bacterium]|nr:hypothetical protein [Clostridia bacterium]
MIRSISQLKKIVHRRAKEEEIMRDEEGRAIIEMTVRRDEDFLSDYSVGRSPQICATVADFLDGAATSFSPKESLTVNVYSDCIDEVEQEVYRSAMKEYYFQKCKENAFERKRNLIASILTGAVGTLVLIATILFSHLWENAVVAEILDIFAWVFLWECADLLCLHGTSLQLTRRRYLRLYDAKLVFFPLNQSNS